MNVLDEKQKISVECDAHKNDNPTRRKIKLSISQLVLPYKQYNMKKVIMEIFFFLIINNLEGFQIYILLNNLVVTVCLKNYWPIPEFSQNWCKLLKNYIKLHFVDIQCSKYVKFF